MNPVHTIPSFSIYAYIFQVVSCLQIFLFKICMRSRLSHLFYILHLSHFPWFDHVQIMKFFIMQFSPASIEVIHTEKLKNNNLLVSLLAFHVGN
jgi:hypothetical protein